MTRAEMLAELREVIDETTTQYAWTESTLLGYLAEGQDRFCERTGYFMDILSTPITLSTGVAIYAIPDRVIQIQDIFNGTKKLGKFQEDDRSKLTNDWTQFDDPETTGVPTAWQTDRESGYITLDKTPTADEDGDTLTLRVWRYSSTALDASGGEPEIPDRFHRACIEWAAYKAYMHHDEEQQDPVKAGDHLRAFEDYTQQGHTAMRRYHGVETRVGTSQAYRT